MIRDTLNQLTGWYNRKTQSQQRRILLLFCTAFLLVLWLTVRFLDFDAKAYVTKVPVSIGQPSGELKTDSTTLKK